MGFPNTQLSPGCTMFTLIYSMVKLHTYSRNDCGWPMSDGTRGTQPTFGLPMHAQYITCSRESIPPGTGEMLQTVLNVRPHASSTDNLHPYACAVRYCLYYWHQSHYKSLFCCTPRHLSTSLDQYNQIYYY